MVAAELDPRLTFDGFVVGPANRLAAAAARRVADAPGVAYNPLFLYSASGLGKTHLLMSIGNQVRAANPRAELVYVTVESLIEALADAGTGAQLRERLQATRLLLLDDAQFLVQRREAQEELLAVWDGVASRGGQIVLASDRPPNEFDGLDRRLLSRFSGGLIADIAPPTPDTRVAIVQRKAAEGGHRLAAGVPDVLARVPYGNVRELHGALNRVLAVQEVEQRLVNASEVVALLGTRPDSPRSEEFGSFLDEIEGAVDELVARHSPEQRLAEAILRWEGDGYRTHRLESALDRAISQEQADSLIRGFEADIARLEAAAAAIRVLDADAPELARVDILLDPDRTDEADQLVSRVRERLTGMPSAGTAGGNGDAVRRRAGRGGAPAPPARRRPVGDVKDEWFLPSERVVWSWPYIEDWLVTEPD
jgi:hypothetical protein